MKNLSMIFLVFILLLSGCTSNDSKDSKDKESDKVVIATWGGDYQKFLTDFVEPEFTKDLNPVYVPENTPTRLTKIQVEKDGKGTFDVINMEDNVMQQLINEDLVMELDYEKIPNAKNINEDLKNPHFIPHIYSAGTIVYNERLVDEVPDSWEVLWDPKYKGKVGVYVTIFSRYLYAAAAITGNVEDDQWDNAWDKLIQLKENEPKFYTSQEQLATALQTGEIAMTISWKARAVQWNDAGGDPIASAIPKEGTFPTVFGTGIAKNATNVENAYEYLNSMLAPNAQTSFATNMGYSPTVSNAELPADIKESIGFTDVELSRIKPVSLDYIAKNYSAWKEMFDKEVAN